MPWLVIHEEGHDPRIYNLELSAVSIGRGKDADLVLPNISVSRHHADLVHEGQDWVVYDRGSQNGTMVNGKRIKHHRLKVGDEVHMGRFRVVFEDERTTVIRKGMIPGRAPSYKMKGREGFLERVTQTDGPNAEATGVLRREDIKQAMASARALERAYLVGKDDPDTKHMLKDKEWAIGGKGAIPCKGTLGFGAAASITWDGKFHVLTKQSMLTTVEVNGNAVSTHNLTDGDTLVIGKSMFRYIN